MTPYDPQRPPPTPPDPDIQEAIAAGIRHFNEGRYFACHDTLEEIWLETHGPSRLFLQGLIQAAVGFHHLGNGNRIGAESQIRRSYAKLAEYDATYAGVDVERFRTELLDWLERIPLMDSAGAGAVDLPKIRIRAAKDADR